MKYENLVKLSIVGVAGLTGCVTQENTEQKEMTNLTLPKEGIVTEGFQMNDCEGNNKCYYFEIDTNPAQQGPEFIGITYFACGAEQMREAVERFPQGAVIDLQKSSPYISELLRAQPNGEPTVVFQKPNVRKMRRAMENQH